MNRQMTGAELLNIPPEQVWSLAEAAQSSNAQPSSIIPPLVLSSSSQNLTNVHDVREMNGLSQMVNRLEGQRYNYFQDLEYLLETGDVDDILYSSNARCGRPFKLPSFPIKAIWCKTVICLMDMESDLPEKLDASVSPLHGMPRYLTSKEDYTFNKAPDAAQTRWRVYSPLRNYVGPEVEEMVEFICAIDGCNRFFRTRDMVVDHVFDFHKLYPPAVFKCNWAECEREDHFGAFYQIETHMQRHKVDRPFECQLEGCDRAYRRLENLRTHMRTHSGEKPYKCKFEFCDRSFTNASDRAKHENRTHSSIKGFPCHIEDCDKLYTDPSSLRKHIINAHGAETYEDHKKEKALERKRKIEQRMIERHILRSMSQPRVSSGGPIRIHTSRLSPTSSLSPRSRNAASISPRSSTSTLSSNMSPNQLSPLPIEAASEMIVTRPNFSMSRILEDLPRPSPPPTTPMFQFPRPTPLNPAAAQHFAHMPPPQQLPVASQYPLPNLLPFMVPNSQMMNALLLARLQMMTVGQQL